MVAGDFNTWNHDRLLIVHSLLAPLGMHLVMTPDNGGFFHLDHIFARGLFLDKATPLNFVTSSDHKPLLVDFLFEPEQITTSSAAPGL
ncbi:MAG: hypothetical protein EOP06_22135 [Proteobacteria bacterium]|nr:MAG: hypothetical protein EOP06_22135 [Pseudomonadota bacterium]